MKVTDIKEMKKDYGETGRLIQIQDEMIENTNIDKEKCKIQCELKDSNC